MEKERQSLLFAKIFPNGESLKIILITPSTIATGIITSFIVRTQQSMPH
jgi:hypothetical protein